MNHHPDPIPARLVAHLALPRTTLTDAGAQAMYREAHSLRDNCPVIFDDVSGWAIAVAAAEVARLNAKLTPRPHRYGRTPLATLDLPEPLNP